MCLQLWDEHFVLAGALLCVQSVHSTSPFYYLSARTHRLNKPNLLCLLSRVSVTPFTTTPSDILSPSNLPSNVFQIMLLSLTQWQETERERGAELDCLDDVEIATWHLHLLDLRTAAARTGWWMAVCERRWSSCLQSAPANVVLLLEKLRWVSLTVPFTCSVTWNIWWLAVQLFNLASDDSRYYVTQILWRPKRVLLNINSVTPTTFHSLC